MARIGKSKGFAHAAGLVARDLEAGTQKRGFSQAMLLTNWAEVVGAEIAAITQPSKVRFAKGGLGATLVVLTNGARAPEVSMQLETIRTRVNACYGYNAISRVLVTQTDAALAGFAERATAFDTPDAPLPDNAAEVFNLEDVKDEGLRAALDRIGNHVLSKSKARSLS